MMEEAVGKIALTGDRPTGKLHIGHLVGSLQRRLDLQNDTDFEKIYILIADAQALTDNFDNPKKVRDNIIEVMLDYLSIGLDPNKIVFCVQSALPALDELTFYYMNLVTTARLKRNPTVKTEIKLKNFNEEEGGIPVGFFCYPVSQAADITAFDANVVPVGEDQEPMLEQTREIVKSFNSTYGETLVMPEILLPKNKTSNRLVGIDGKAKMSKSLNNTIFLSDSYEVLQYKIMKKMYTDENHLKVTDPGKIEGNVVFFYLDIFCENDSFERFLPDYKNLDEMKDHYKRGGLGDVKCKKFLLEVLNDKLSKYREIREKWENNINNVYDILFDGTQKAQSVTNNTLERVKQAMKINYFVDKQKMINEWMAWLKESKALMLAQLNEKTGA